MGVGLLCSGFAPFAASRDSKLEGVMAADARKASSFF
jgi:hypothetical protein